MPTPLKNAVRALAGGGVIAYPTEGVWGLGCEPLNRHACERLLAMKQRDPAKGLILIAHDFEALADFVAPVEEKLLKKALATWPGAHTWIFPAGWAAPEWITGAHDGIAVRVTAHPVARALCRAYGGAIVSTSANVAGRPAARSALQVRRIFGGELDALVPGALGGARGATPIRDLRSDRSLRA